MTRQRQILVTVTYNELGCIIDTKAEPYKEPNLQPTCNNLATDTISRQAAIDEIRKCRFVVDAIEKIRALPSAQPEQKWIPCSERLPEKPNMYTVTDSKGDVVRFVFDDTESSREYWLRCAKAWMPLPEPYEGNRNG